MIKSLDRSTVKQLSEAFLNALKPLEKTYGIKINPRGARFSSTTAAFKFDASVIGAEGEVLSRERQDYKLWAHNLGLNENWLDQEFSWNGKFYKVTGLKTRCWKSPVLVERADSKKFKMAAEWVITGFNRKGVK